MILVLKVIRARRPINAAERGTISSMIVPLFNRKLHQRVLIPSQQPVKVPVQGMSGMVLFRDYDSHSGHCRRALVQRRMCVADEMSRGPPHCINLEGAIAHVSSAGKRGTVLYASTSLYNNNEDIDDDKIKTTSDTTQT